MNDETQNISGHKMLSHLDRIVNDHRPITADVFITNYCNNNCPYCTYHRWELESGSRYMDFDNFKKYAMRLRSLGVEGIILTGGGEPTINPDFDQIAEWLTQNSIPWGINTNFNVLKFCKPNYLKVSLDGWSEESYKKSRGVKGYEHVRENIERYGNWKTNNSPKTSLGIQMVAQDIESVLNFYNANHDLPVDYIVIRPVESTCGSYYKKIDREKVKQSIIEAVKGLEKSDSRVKLNYKWNMLDVKQETCTAQWAQIALNEKGEVLYCCHKPYEIVGHIMDKGILQKKENYKTDMSMCDVPCRMTAPNKFVHEVMEPRADSYFI